MFYASREKISNSRREEEVHRISDKKIYVFFRITDLSVEC